MYKHPSFNYTWSYKKKTKKKVNLDTFQVVDAGILLSKNGSLTKKPKTILQELAKHKN